MKGYLPRFADSWLKKTLESAGAVLIDGPKWCGKTTTASRQAQSSLFMQDPDRAESYLMAADTKPSILLQGDVPRLVDEWQMAPVLWDAVRFAVDQRGAVGQFILTGSAVPTDDSIMHSGTGRISKVTMRPMSLFESEESNGQISLGSLFDGATDVSAVNPLSLEEIAFVLARGGWPAALKLKQDAALRPARDYVEAVINTDVSRVDGIKKNPDRVRALLRSLARNISTEATMSTIRTDMAADDESLSEKATTDYMRALRRIFVLDELPAWNPALRSKTAIRSTPTRHLVDPSLAVAVLRTDPDGLLGDFNTFGLLFESLCVRDLRIYAQANDGELFHYRDKTGLESDAVVVLHDGRWGAVEVKMGSAKIEEAAQHLLELAQRVDTQKMRDPSFLMVVTSTEFAYQRKDGVLVVPIGCLRD